MAEKKIQENPLPEEQDASDKPKDMVPDKPTSLPIPIPVPEPVVPRPVPSFTKTPPNDLYRRLLPAVLFVLTFVTVMTMLLIYMDTVALGAQQFRLNMSRDYELARIPQESAALVAYVRQLHLQPRRPRPAPPNPPPSERAKLLDTLTGDIRNGTFVEFMPRGPRDPTTLYLEAAKDWEGVVVRAAARDYLALRGEARALHACLSPTVHPREVNNNSNESLDYSKEISLTSQIVQLQLQDVTSPEVTYPSSDSHESMFSSRVLCLPLYTVLLAAEAARAQYVLLAGRAAPSALRHVPLADGRVRLQVIEFRSTDPAARNMTTEYLTTKNYTVAATYDDGVVYALKDV